MEYQELCPICHARYLGDKPACPRCEGLAQLGEALASYLSLGSEGRFLVSDRSPEEEAAAKKACEALTKIRDILYPSLYALNEIYGAFANHALPFEGVEEAIPNVRLEDLMKIHKKIYDDFAKELGSFYAGGSSIEKLCEAFAGPSSLRIDLKGSSKALPRFEAKKELQKLDPLFAEAKDTVSKCPAWELDLFLYRGDYFRRGYKGGISAAKVWRALSLAELSYKAILTSVSPDMSFDFEKGTEPKRNEVLDEAIREVIRP